MVTRALNGMVRLDVARKEDGVYRLSPTRIHPQFPRTRDIVEYLHNFHQETLEGGREVEMTRAVVVTGASSGIGAATATLLAQRGFLTFAGAPAPTPPPWPSPLATKISLRCAWMSPTARRSLRRRQRSPRPAFP